MDLCRIAIFCSHFWFQSVLVFICLLQQQPAPWMNQKPRGVDVNIGMCSLVIHLVVEVLDSLKGMRLKWMSFSGF